mmetsp:Transcript_37693/g.100312  ORF Transcript_37693/g.100312 Transcript_37693/m.100312 type:complete len:202 (+) Transcript_37693:951-1556(+)
MIVCKVLAMALQDANTFATRRSRMIRRTLNVRRIERPPMVLISHIAMIASAMDVLTTQASNRFHHFSRPKKKSLLVASIRMQISKKKKELKDTSTSDHSIVPTSSPRARENSFFTSLFVCRPKAAAFARITIEQKSPKNLLSKIMLLTRKTRAGTGWFKYLPIVLVCLARVTLRLLTGTASLVVARCALTQLSRISDERPI